MATLHAEEKTCAFCAKTFHQMKNLKAHFITHFPVTYTCKICNTFVCTPLSLNRHNNEWHSKENPERDLPKEKQTAYLNKIKAKVRKETSESDGKEGEDATTSFKCKDCERTFSKLSHLHLHENFRHKDKSESRVDTNASSSSSAVQETLTPSHPPTQEELTCNLCLKEFRSLNILAQHRVTHKQQELNFACDKCHLKFKTQNFLANHKKLFCYWSKSNSQQKSSTQTAKRSGTSISESDSIEKDLDSSVENFDDQNKNTVDHSEMDQLNPPENLNKTDTNLEKSLLNNETESESNSCRDSSAQETFVKPKSKDTDSKRSELSQESAHQTVRSPPQNNRKTSFDNSSESSEEDQWFDTTETIDENVELQLETVKKESPESSVDLNETIEFQPDSETFTNGQTEPESSKRKMDELSEAVTFEAFKKQKIAISEESHDAANSTEIESEADMSDEIPGSSSIATEKEIQSSSNVSDFDESQDDFDKLEQTVNDIVKKIKLSESAEKEEESTVPELFEFSNVSSSNPENVSENDSVGSDHENDDDFEASNIDDHFEYVSKIENSSQFEMDLENQYNNFNTNNNFESQSKITIKFPKRQSSAESSNGLNSNGTAETTSNAENIFRADSRFHDLGEVTNFENHLRNSLGESSMDFGMN